MKIYKLFMCFSFFSLFLVRCFVTEKNKSQPRRKKNHNVNEEKFIKYIISAVARESHTHMFTHMSPAAVKPMKKKRSLQINV